MLTGRPRQASGEDAAQDLPVLLAAGGLAAQTGSKDGGRDAVGAQDGHGPVYLGLGDRLSHRQAPQRASP